MNLIRCNLCCALLLNEWDEKSHMEWHEKVAMKCEADICMEEAVAAQNEKESHG